MRWLKIIGVWLALMLAVNGAVRISGLHPGIAIVSVLLMAALAGFLLSHHSGRRGKAHRELLALDAAKVLRSHLQATSRPERTLRQVDLNATISTGARSKTKLPRLELIYTNTRDITQKRLISPYRSGANIDYFNAWCFLEDQRRSFCFYRVDHAVDTETGEVLSQAALYRLIHPKRTAPTWLKEDIS